MLPVCGREFLVVRPLYVMLIGLPASGKPIPATVNAQMLADIAPPTMKEFDVIATANPREFGGRPDRYWKNLRVCTERRVSGRTSPPEGDGGLW